MTDPIKAGPFLGMNNKLPVEKLNTKEGTFVRDATNVDLTNAGTFQRRGGISMVSASPRASSLWSDGTTGFWVDNGVLKSFNGTVSATIATLTDPTATVSLTETPRGVVWSDGLKLQLISGGITRPLAIPAPNPDPSVAATTGGSMAAGSYFVSFVAVDAYGEWSVPTNFQLITVPAAGAMNITLVASSYATNVFVSDVNGSELYLEATIPAGVTTFRLGNVLSEGSPLDTEVMAPMPPGDIVRMYRGRLLTVQGNCIYYSIPYGLGLYYPSRNFVLLDKPVTLCEPTQDGVFLATATDTWFSDGHDFATAILKPLAPYGAIPNTAVSEPQSLNMYWFTPRGIVHTKDDNTLDLKQDTSLAFANADRGAALYREENGIAQIITVLSNAVPTAAASASSYMDATTVN